MKVYEVLAGAFRAEGARAVFALMGDGNKAWLVTMAGLPGVRLYSTRHEGPAVAMADGYARATGDVGVCSVTYGSGLTQIATQLMVAKRHGTPLVVFVPDTLSSDKGMGGQIDIDQRRFIEASGGVFQMLRSPSTAPEDVCLAFYKARSLRAPVVLNAPIDLQEAEYPLDWDEATYRPSAEMIPPRSALQPDPEQLAAAMQIFAAAKRPIVLAGRGAVEAGAREETLELAERIGALLATTLPTKGWFDGQPFSLGVAGLYLHQSLGELFAEADCVVAVGASLNTFTTVGGYLFPQAKVVHIDRRPDALIDQRRLADLYLQGDARATLHALNAGLLERGHRTPGYRTNEIAERLRSDARLVAIECAPFAGGEDLDPRELMLALDGVLPDDCLVTVGVGHFTSFPVMYLSNPRARTFEIILDFVTIGQSVPTAVGAALARPDRPVVAFEGDASFMMHLQELETAVRYGAHVLIVVLNDGALGAEYHKLRAAGLDPAESVLPTPDLVGLASAFGVPARRLASVSDAPAIARWFGAGKGPHLVEARISRSVVGPL